jgi:hypothetical protein
MSTNGLSPEELQAFREALADLTGYDLAVVIAMLQHIRVLALSEGEAAAEAALARAITALIESPPPSRDLQEAPQRFIPAPRAAIPAAALP